MRLNLLHPRWDGLWDSFGTASLLATVMGWMLAPTEMPWWWALIPTACLIVYVVRNVMQMPPAPRPLKQLRRNHIGQLVSSDPRPPRTRRLP